MSAAFKRQLRKRKLKSEINVVPYIDVMLVLLIIFMVTAPLLNLGVDIDLPESDARAVDQQKKPLTVSVDARGKYTLTMPDQTHKQVDAIQLVAEVQALVRADPTLAVIVAGDRKASYDTVYTALVLLKEKAGVRAVSLLSKSSEAN
jgi:biopolymer transport protein TolR